MGVVVLCVGGLCDDEFVCECCGGGGGCDC